MFLGVLKTHDLGCDSYGHIGYLCSGLHWNTNHLHSFEVYSYATHFIVLLSWGLLFWGRSTHTQFMNLQCYYIFRTCKFGNKFPGSKKALYSWINLIFPEVAIFLKVQWSYACSCLLPVYLYFFCSISGGIWSGWRACFRESIPELDQLGHNKGLGCRFSMPDQGPAEWGQLCTGGLGSDPSAQDAAGIFGLTLSFSFLCCFMTFS